MSGSPEEVAIILCSIIIGLLQIAKKLGLPEKYCPIVAVVLGIVLAILYVGATDIKKAILVGIWIGLASVGLYSGFKNTVQK